MEKEAHWVLNNLGFDSKLKIYQDKAMFNYSVDTLLLGNFLNLKRVSRALEIGANNGALSIFVAARKHNLQIDAIEIQKKAYQLALYNVAFNRFSEQINLIHGDFKAFAQDHAAKQKAKYEHIFVNPPYYPVANLKGLKINQAQALAQYEISLDLETIIKASAKIITYRGFLSFVIPALRFFDLVILLNQYRFQIKRVQFVFSRIKGKLKFVLVESRFMSPAGTEYLENLYLHTDNEQAHQYREEIKALYQPQIVT